MEYFVAPNGSDTNPGTRDKPFATLAGARDAVRGGRSAEPASDVRVVIAGGVYPQSQTLVFGPRDGGTEKHSVTYAAEPGQTVVLTGGRRITGWTKGQGEIWTAELPEVRAGKWDFRQLFVNGRRAVRARLPKRDDAKPWRTITTSSIKLGADGFFPEPPAATDPITLGVDGPIKSWKNLTDVELVWIYNNVCSRRRLAALDESAQTFAFRPPYTNIVPRDTYALGFQLCLPAAGRACYFENALEMLTQPGEWYLDRATGVLHYWPRAGENLAQADVVAPMLRKTLLAITGTPQKPVRNLHFDGLHVEHVEQPLAAEGHFGGWNGQQIVAGADGKSARSEWMDAAVCFRQARGCGFRNGGIAHVGGMGLTLLEGTAGITVEGNEVQDVGGGGIAAGAMRYRHENRSFDPEPREGEYTGYRIANNHVHDCGTEYFGSVGIEADLTRDTVIAHNLVHDIPYSGIVCYGNMVHDPPFARDNRIEFNHIYRVLTISTDGAGIYAILPQAGRGTVIRNNLIHDLQHYPFNTRPERVSHGIYLDLLAKNYHLEDNVVFRAADCPLRLLGNQTADNTWADNVLMEAGEPPREFIDAMAACVGLERVYRGGASNDASPAWSTHTLRPLESAGGGWNIGQYGRDDGAEGVLKVVRRPESKQAAVRIGLVGLIATADYELKGWVSSVGPAKTPDGQLSDVVAAPQPMPARQLAESEPVRSGQQLMNEGLRVTLDEPSQVGWVMYRNKKGPPNSVPP